MSKPKNKAGQNAPMVNRTDSHIPCDRQDVEAYARQLRAMTRDREAVTVPAIIYKGKTIPSGVFGDRCFETRGGN